MHLKCTADTLNFKEFTLAKNKTDLLNTLITYYFNKCIFFIYL